MKFVFLILLALIVSAVALSCAAPIGVTPPLPKHKEAGSCDRTFIVAPEFTPDERAAMQSAVERWNAVATEQFCLQSSNTPGEAEQTEHGVFRVIYGSDYWKQLSQQAGGSDVLGVHWSTTDQIAIVGTKADLFELIALHEFGHAHGLSHVPPPAIMCAYVGTATDFTPNDLAECVRAGACEGDAGSVNPESQQQPDVQFSKRGSQ